MSHFVPATPLDHWIGRELKRSYDSTLAEPVPDALRLLLERFPSEREGN